RRAWIRLGRDIVGQRTEVVVARNRFGPPGRRAELRILYAEGGGRDDCLTNASLLQETPIDLPTRTSGTHHATASPLLATPSPQARSAAPGAPRSAARIRGPSNRGHAHRVTLDLVAGGREAIPLGAGRPGRPALGGRR